MIIEKNISAYVVQKDQSLLEALSKIDANKEGFVFVVDESGVLEGILTDGDFRRSLLANKIINLQTHAGAVANSNCISAGICDKADSVAALFSDKIRFVPLTDQRGRLVGMARRRQITEGIKIAEHIISEESKAFIIAEIGINHNGSIKIARELISAAKNAGADCVKFQMRNLNELYRNSANDDISEEDLGTQYTLNLLKRFELPAESMLELFEYSKSMELTPLCTPWETESLRILEQYGMPAYKVASADMTNHPFIAELTGTYKPLIVSTGMSTEEEIRETVKLLQNSGAAYCLLHCNSTYPAPFKDININYLARLKQIGDCVVGYSGHERGIAVVMASVAKGAKIIEKHITLDREMEGSDHKVSLLPDEFRMMVNGIREVEASLGSQHPRLISQGEAMNRSNLAKSLIINCDLKKDAVIEEQMIEIKSPGRGLQPHRKAALIGRKARRDFLQGDFFFPSDLEELQINARRYNFNRPWGITARWHDFKTILPKTNPEFIEFHLSFKDMDEDFRKYFDCQYEIDLKVHSPDTFNGDHLLDLSNPDKAHRQRSVRELQRVINLTRDLKEFFPNAKCPVIIASLGGFTTDRFLTAKEVKERYKLMRESLTELDRKGVELIGQSLPPFPWYFGGQLFLNLFVHPEDTAAFCHENDLRLCFDISHSKLTCNYFKYSLKHFTDQIAPYVAHLHMADAAGVDGEGLQIQEGEIDFPALIEQLSELCPRASFIPEIWQGHKNEGEGFWIALERLEALKL